MVIGYYNEFDLILRKCSKKKSTYKSYVLMAGIKFACLSHRMELFIQ
jgi:hypothetical protein